jgi:phosphopantothenoylcysteine decarboxylase/phosphopantothenate--cysteine ligase
MWMTPPSRPNRTPKSRPERNAQRNHSLATPMMVPPSPRFPGKRIVLGVTGSIAAYKAVELLRSLVQEGADVSVVMTSSATRFVAPLTFEVLSKRPVATDLFAAHDALLHLTLTERADVVLIAPATAHLLATAALGLADDLLGTLLLATQCPVIMAPAMDGGMWDHPAVQGHVARLLERGVTILAPEVGPLASGRVGRGRLVDTSTILDAVAQRLAPRQDWLGQRLLVSAGPTHEPIDPVRVLSNRSSGKMGYAIAEAARARGAQVVLVSGPTTLATPAGIERVDVTTAEEMYKAVTTRLSWATVVIMAAAVGDFRPAQISSQKLERTGAGTQNLQLEPTADILSALAAQRRGQLLVGFAAETGPVLPRALDKLKRKGVDLLVANDVTQDGAGFGTDTNVVVLLDRTGKVTELPKMPKRELADHLLDAVLRLERLLPGGQA